MKSPKTVEQKFQKLDDISHVLLRPARYLGSVNPHTATAYVVNDEGKMVKEEITWCPALIKGFDEVISNSVDFSKTEDGKHLDTIKVFINRETGELGIHDNGGIVVVKHQEHEQWIPEMIFELKAGSNFNDEDDSVLTGQNGEGAALTAIFSESFTVKTADGKHMFQQTHTENSRRKSEPKIIKSANQLTHIDWVPDYAKLNLEGLDEGNYKKLVKRVYDIAGCNPKLRIFLNGKHIHIRSFEDYVALYADQYAYDQNDNWRIGVSKAYDGFEHVSFVNTTQTNIGGVHIIYVINQITEKLREYFKKKHKVEVKPADIRNHICLFVDATIQKPRYNGQTKDDLVSEVRTWGTSWECPDKLIQKILKLDVVESILDWVKAREAANLNAELRKMAKDNTKADPRKVDKFSDANEKKDRHQCELYLAEGDSARLSIQSARGKNPYIGSFSLRGKPLNIQDTELKDIITNAEIRNILTITGLEFGKKVESINDLRFGKIVAMTDADLDGQHIFGLLLNIFSTFWPELFELGVIYRLVTPLYLVQAGKEELEFFTDDEYHEWCKKGIKHKFDYFKGLGTFESAQFKKIIDNREKYLVKVNALDEIDLEKLNLAFSGKQANARKDWLSEANYFSVTD